MNYWLCSSYLKREQFRFNLLSKDHSIIQHCRPLAHSEKNDVHYRIDACSYIENQVKVNFSELPYHFINYKIQIALILFMNLSIMTGDRINPYHSKKKYNNSFTYYCSSICRAISENISGKRRTHDSSAQVVRPSILIYYIYTNIYI